MLSKNLLVNLLYRYKLVKQAALRNYIKEAHLKQLSFRNQIQRLMDLYKANSLLKKTSLSDELYKQALLTKSAYVLPSNPNELGDAWLKVVRGIQGTQDATEGTAEAAKQSRLLSKLKQWAKTNIPKMKPSRAGLIGTGIGALLTAIPAVYAGSRMGRSSSSAYERGKADALSNLTEEKLRTILGGVKADALKNLNEDQLRTLLEQIKKQSIQA